MDIGSHRTVQEFFHEALGAALRNQGIDSSEMTEFYLVNLLSDYAHMPLDDEPLALRLQSAATALPAERARQLREVGDRSLYVSGFFSDSLQRRLVDVDYYIQIGGSAYGQLARMGSSLSGPFEPVYHELSGRFPDFVEVLSEVSKGSALTSDRGVVELYERWLKTGSEWIERKLRAQGVIPGKPGDSE